VGRLEELARSRPDVIDYREELARNRVNLGLVLSGMGRHADGEGVFRSAITEYETLVSARPTMARYRADLATARLHLSQALAALHRPDEAEQARKAAIADYDWLMATNPHDYRTNLASVILTLTGAAPASAAPEQPGPAGMAPATPPPTPMPPTGTEEGAARITDSTVQPPPGPPVALPEQPAEMRARFTRVREHARGGSSRIWIARDNDLNREVVIKELSETLANDPAARQRFLKEAQITSQLEHPNIVPIHGLGYRSGDDTPFLIMRYVRGQELRQAIQEYHSHHRDDQELRWLLRAFVGACRGVAFAHSRGVLHRDPKPSNILLGVSGEVFVVDWGLAKILGEPGAQEATPRVTLTEWADPQHTLQGTVIGTPAYMAPEMAQGHDDLVDARTDVYVLGAGLFELLTGRPPYLGQSPIDVVRAIVTSDPPRARSVNPSVPAALDAICARAMARQPEHRYPSASELGADVERWLGGESVSVHHESFLKRWWRQWGH
jgi:tRNA A-37 threonylcarbamoyl transferase component Bud32